MDVIDPVTFNIHFTPSLHGPLGRRFLRHVLASTGRHMAATTRFHAGSSVDNTVRW